MSSAARGTVRGLLVLLASVLLAGCLTIEVPAPTGAGPTDRTAEPLDPGATAEPADATEREVEAHVMELANQARVDEGLGELVRNPGLDDVARRWSQHLAASGGELAHNPDFSGEIPSGWVKSGENVGWTDATRLDARGVAELIHEGWMDSPGHRENLLGEYTDLGVGVAHHPEHGYYLTQNFATY